MRKIFIWMTMIFGILLEILFVLLFAFYAAAFHSSLSVSVFMLFECAYIVLAVINSFLLKKRRHAFIAAFQFFLFAAGLVLIVSESSLDGLKEGRAFKIPRLSEAVFLAAFLVMICSVLFLLCGNMRNLSDNNSKKRNNEKEEN